MDLRSFRIYLIYGAPHLIVIWLYAGVMVVQGIYAKFFGLGLTAIASVLLIARLFDAISDPVIAYLSDRQLRRRGTRKPMMAAGGIIIVIAAYMLFVPFGVDIDAVTRGDKTATVSVAYFAVFFILYYFGMTVFEIPHLAWAGELAPTSAEKTNIFGIRGATTKIGAALFYLIPLLPFLPSREITPQTMQISAILAGLIMIPSLYLMVVATPSRSGVGEKQSAANKPTHRRPFLGDVKFVLRSIVQNRPLAIFVGIALSSGIALGIISSLIFIYVDMYLGLGAYFAQASLIGMLAALVMIPVTMMLARVFEKKHVWFAGKVGFLISIILIGMLTPDNASPALLIALLTFKTIAIAGSVVLSPAIMSEIADYGALKSGEEHTASYFSVHLFFQKVNLALGGGIGLGIAGMFGFDPSLTEHAETSVFGLKLAFLLVPCLLLICGLVLTAMLPITRRRHGIIRKRLDTLRVRTEAAGDKIDTQPSKAERERCSRPAPPSDTVLQRS